MTRHFNRRPHAGQTMLAVYRQVVARAYIKGIAMFGAALTPFEGAGYDSPEKDMLRQTVNQ